MDVSELLDSSSNIQEKIISDIMPVDSESDDELSPELQELMDEDSAEENEDDSLDSILNALNPNLLKKRKRASEFTQAFDQSEFAPSSNQVDGRRKIGFEDLVGAISGETGFGKLKKQISALEDGAAATVDAPLAPRMQDKINRRAANESSSQAVSRWTGIVKQNREALQLQFPMNEMPRANLTSGSLVAKFQPSTSMEMEINDALIKSGLTEDKQNEAETLELNKISAEEVDARRQELSKLRALMFFKEQKQKKIAKIKSKTYRKIRKRGMENRMNLSIDELEKMDPQMAHEAREKAEYERAKERMTLKHKNSGKWAKQMLGRKTENNFVFFSNTGSKGNLGTAFNARAAQEENRRRCYR